MHNGPSTPFGSSGFGSAMSAFGSTAGSSFGSSGFGSGSSLFGAKPTTTAGFGAATGSQTGTGLFGNTATGSTGLFGAQKTGGFGGFGTSGTTGGLFGTSGTSGTSLFSGSTNAFGNANKSIFGASTNAAGSIFGAPTTNTGTSLFGNKPQATGGIFGSSATTTTGGLFGNNAAVGAGTPTKFTPQTSTDTMMKNGISSNINTKHQCITLMKEYDKKSIEELRMEDYQLGRKGPQATGTGTSTGTGLFGNSFGTSTGGSTFGTGGFGASTGSSLFGQGGQTSSIFGAKTTSGGLFGNSSTTFSAPSAFTNTSGSMFGNKPGGLFGPTTTTQSTGFFGTTPAFPTASSGTSLFGAPSFGQTTQQAGVFGATSQSGSSLFGKSTFVTNTSGSTLFGTSTFGQTTQPSLFGPKTATGTLGTFGTTNTGGLFGTQNKPAFGTTFGTGTAGTSLFGSTPAGGGLFGNTTGTFGFGTTGSALGQPSGSTLGGTFGQATLGGAGNSWLGLGQNSAAALQQQQQMQQQLQQQVLALTSSPFGDSPLFRNLTSRTKTDKPLALTSPGRQRGTNTPSQYKVSPRPSARIKPRAIGKLNFSQARLFDGLDDDIEYSSETFVPRRRSIKKLVLNSKPQARSISSELSSSSHNSDKERQDSPEISQIKPTSKSNGEISRDKFFSPKPNTSLGNDDKDSPLVGVRRSNTPKDEEDSGSPRINGVQSAVHDEENTTQSEPLNAVGHEDRESDDEQGSEPREDETLAGEAQRNSQQRGCGVILERREYYCNPSIAELDDMVDENGDVIVGDFVVGREGFGMVKFFGECNVAGLNLDEIVCFRRREIEVYPDTYPDKPPVGDGLNRKSEVTLYKVWPNDKTTRTPIKNPDRLQKVGWLEKLETATARLGATFVDYQAETGTWIFTVEHFTRYGLKEVQIEMEDGSVSRPPLRSFHEDKEKLLEEARMEKEKAAIAMKMRMEEDMENRKKLMAEKMYDDEYLEAPDDSQMTDISRETFPEFQEPLEEDDNTASPASHHLATALGVKSHRMQVMKASFFGDNDEPQQHDYINNSNMRSKEFRLGNKSVLNSTSFDESIHERPIYSPVKTKSMTIYPESQSQSDTRTAKERRIEYENYRNKSLWYSLPQPILLPSVIGSPSEAALKAAGIRTQPALVPLSQSVTAGKHHLYADAGLTMGRSFRVGWGPAWTLVYSSRAMNVSPDSSDQRLGREIVRGSPLIASSVGSRQSSSFAIKFARVNVSPTMKWNSDVSQAQLIERLEICLANISRDADDTSPCFSSTEGVTALHQYAEAGAKSKETLASGTFKKSAETFSSIMDLAVALWGDLSILSKDVMDTDNEDVAMDGYDEALARKEALSNWLAKISRTVIQEEIENIKAKDDNHLRIIFSFLTGKQTNAACEVAQSNGDSRLSLLLAQSSGNMVVRQWLLKQLDDWLEHKVDKFITADRLKIYALLAGELAWRDIMVCEDLDWKRTFALHLWYQRSSGGLIPDAMTSYENSFKGRTSTGIYAAEPSPSYNTETLKSRIEEGPEEIDHKACRDTCYHLIKLFCKRSHRLEKTLAPASYTQYQLDVSLSWHLYQVLRSVGYTHLSEYYESYLNTSYAGQLEAMGLWHWAVFVLMHIQDPLRREQAIQKVLVRYCILDDDPNYSEKEGFLVNDLGIPVAWIHEAKVIRARMENRPKEEAYHLLKSCNFDLSHEVILNRLASSAIINEEYESIKELLVEIAPRENSSQVNQWNTGGQIYLDYIKLWEKFYDIKNGLLVPNTYQLEKMQTKVSSLCHRISHLPSKTAIDRLCQSDMGTMCANFLKIIAKELAMQSDESGSSYHTQSSVLAPHIEKLPLPEDCCLTELRELTSSYIDELAKL